MSIFERETKNDEFTQDFFINQITVRIWQAPFKEQNKKEVSLIGRKNNCAV